MAKKKKAQSNLQEQWESVFGSESMYKSKEQALKEKQFKSVTGSNLYKSREDALKEINQRKQEEQEQQRREALYSRVGKTNVLDAGNRINSTMNSLKRENAVADYAKDYVRDTLGIKPKKTMNGNMHALGTSKPAQTENKASITGALVDMGKEIKWLEEQKNITKNEEEQRKLQNKIEDLKNKQYDWLRKNEPVSSNSLKDKSKAQAEKNPNSIINKILQKNGIENAPSVQKEKDDMQRIMKEGMANPLTDRDKYISDFYKVQQSGQYQGSDIKQKSTEQLMADLAELEKKIANEPNEDERRKIFEEKDKVKAVYGTLAMNGVPYGYKGEYLQKRPDDYFEDATYQNEYDKTLYDYIYGPGEYEKRIEEAQTDEDIDKLDAELEDLWVSIENGSIGKAYENAQDDAFEANKAINEKSVNQREAEKIRKELEQRTKTREMIENAPDVSGEYDPSLLKMYTVKNNIMNQMFLPGMIGAEFQSGDEIDKIWQAANNPFNPVEEGYLFGKNNDTDLSNLAEINPAYFMNPEQVETFNKYYQSGDKAGAKAFYDGLYTYLQTMATNYKMLLIDQMSRNEYAPVMITTRALTPEIAGIYGTIGSVKGLLEGKDPEEILNSPYLDLAKANQTIQAARADVMGDRFAKWFGEEWREAGERTGGLLYSVVDNARRALITKGVSGAIGLPMNSTAAKTFDFMMLGSDVLSNQMATNLANGMEPDEAFVRAMGNAAIEVITENMWWDSMFSTDVKDLLGTPGKFAKFMGNSFMQEGAEEVSGNVMETLFDEFASQLYGHESELDKQYHELVNSGVDPAEAKGQVLENWMKEAGWSFLEGGLSALMLSGGRGVAARTSEYMINTDIGNKALSSGLENTTDSKAVATNELQNEIKLLDAAEKMGPTTESGELAAQIRKNMKKGRNISKADFGKLARTIYGETNAQIGGIVKNVLQENIVKDLQEMNEENADELSEIIAKRVAGAELTNAEKFKLSQSENAKSLAMAYGMGLPLGNVAKVESQIREEAKNPLSIRETINDILTTGVEREKAVGDVETMMKGSETAGNITRLMNGSKDSRKVEFGGEVASIKAFISKVVEIEKGNKGNRIFVQMDNNQEADISDVRGLSENAAKVLRYIQMDNNRMGSNRVAEILLAHANDTEDIAGMVYDAMKVRVSTVLGLDAPKTKLDAKMVEEIRQAAMDDFNDAEEKRIKNQRQINPGKGRTIYNGVDYGTNAFTEAIKKLNKMQRNEAFAIGVIAKAAGLDVELYNDPKNTKEQGSYTAAGGIRINLAGTYNEEGWHRGALATFAHEITHQLEGNSREAYAQLRQFVINNLQRNGENVEERLRGIMDTYAKNGQQLDLNGAIAELVAKSSEQVLTDENVIRSLRESDPNLYGRIRKVVSSLVERIRTAIGLAKETSSYYSKALGNVADDLSRLWLGAYQEAKQATGTTDETENVQASQQEEHRPQTIDIQDAIKNPRKYDSYFTYENLIKKDPIKLIQLDQIDINKTRRDILDAGMKNARTHGKTVKGRVFVHVYDTNTDVEIDEDGLRHGLNHKIINQPITEKIGEVLSEAVLINTSRSREKGSDGMYWMLGAGKNSDGKGTTYAILSINKKNNKLERIDALYGIRSTGVDVNNNKKTAATKASDQSTKGPSLTVSYANIADALEVVKDYLGEVLPIDVMNYYGVQRKQTKDTPYLQHSFRDEIDKTTEKQANDILNKNGVIAYVPAQYSFAGEYADEKYGDKVRQAFRMERQGASDDEIRKETNCIRGYNGHWWLILDNNKMGLKVPVDEIKTDKPYHLFQIYDADELMEAYPKIKWSWVRFADLGRGVTGSTEPHTMEITVSTEQLKRGKDFVEATLQHEIQHLIQTVEGTESGASVEFWKDMQDMARARIANNDREINKLYEKYGIDATRELAFGIEFNEDGSLDEEWLFPEELEKIRKMTPEELNLYRDIEKDSKKWIKLLQNNRTYENLYLNTVGEIEARAAAEKTDENTQIRYPDNAVTTEEYTRTPTSKAGASLLPKDDIDHLFGKHEQFSMQEPVEKNEAGLIAVHNLNEEQLIKTMGLGGFPMPSIAVIKNDYAHNRYGDISVVFYPSAVDPQASRYNKVYGGDAWTPTYPTIEYKLNTKLLDRAMKKIDKLLPADFRTDQVEMYADNLERSINSARGDMIKAIKDNRRLQLAYLYDRGEKFTIPTREKRLTSGFDNEEVKAVAEALGEELVTEAYENGYQYMDAHPEVVKKIVDTLNNQWKEKIKGKVTTLKLLNMVPYEADKFGFNKFDNITGGAYRYFRQGTTGETDEYALQDALKERIDEEDYINWLHEKFDGLVEKSGVRNNKDYFTNSGTPRSWEALHDEETLENIVNIMRSQNSKGENAFFSQSAMLALGTKDFRSLEDIRKSKGQLQHLTEEEYSAAKENIINGFSELMDELMDKGDNNPFIARQRALEAMVEAVRKSKTAAGIMKELRQWRGLDLKEDVGQRIAALVKEIGELPTEYFEAKPQRGVGFDEIAKVAIPENASQRLKTMMDQYGIPYETYDGTDEDRLRVLNSVEDAQFSFQDETELDVGHWMMTVKEDALQTEAEKQMLKKYKDLRMRLDMREMRKSELRNKIAPLEMIPEDQRTEEQKKMLKKLNDQMGHTQRVIDDTLEELARASSAEGFARMMYQESKVLNNFIYGRTQAEVRDAVEAMEKNAGTIAQRIAENREAIKELEKSGVVQAVKKVLGRTTVEQAAAELKKAYNSTWTKNEILNYLNPIILKMSQGEDISFDVEELAGILIDSDRTNVYEELNALRGLTIRVGQGMLKELRARNSSIKEIRRRLAGTGINVVTAKEIKDDFGNTVGRESSTLEQDLESLRAEYPGMPDFGNEKDALENFVSWVEGMKRSGAAEFYDQRLAEAMAAIMQKAASAMNNIYMPTESKAQKQVLALIEYIKTLNAKTEKLEKNLNDIAADMEKMQKAGANATSMVNVLHRDVNIAIDYYNKMAKIAEDNAKQQKQNKIIEQLKSKHAEKILKNNEEWRNLIERDKQARAQAEDNRRYRNWINRALKAMYQKLRNPKGINNIPEYMQGLARYLLETFVDNDLTGGMRFTDKTLPELAEIKRVLNEWNKESGTFNPADLNDAESEDVVRYIITDDLETIEEGIRKINSEIHGKNRLDTLQQRGEILRQMQEAVTEIWSAIRAENTVQIKKRRIAVEDQAYKIAQLIGNRRKKEWTGKAGRAIAMLHKGIVSGNMTPEYFFRTLANAGLSDLWENYHDAENRNGLELKRAQERLSEIAKAHGYDSWDVKKKVTLNLENGQKVEMTIGQLMSLYATWKREIALGPNVSEHLAGGGFFAEQDLREGLLGRSEQEKRAHRIEVIRNEKGEIVESPDMNKVANLLTDEQKQFVDDVVGFMSNDMSELGNEASMSAYGIKLYKEGYYFPFQIWNGVKSRKSNDAGSAAAANDRAFHPSFAKSRIHGANNALVIGDFMQTAADHIAGMINYATMGLANENMQKVLNTQLQEAYGEDETNKRNIWAMMEEGYGQEAVQYLRKLQEQLNGGAVRIDKTFYDKLISLFRKNAVAGSLSVAMQQPLSYIRAAMMINPKYLAQAMNPIYWKGSYAEMLKHSGVAVIKDMGRFDMNFGQSAREFLMPDAKETNLKKTWEFVKDKSTIMPELMDRMTWTRMWSAVKAEQKALHPEMDVKSEEFLDLCGERFNDVMRRTQVYDSVLVKSANMRSQDKWLKSLTSFMAEPTLTINVLADAVRQIKTGEVKGMAAANLASKTAAIFLLSAAMQAAIKALFASGRTPDEKKTWLENFMNRFGSNLTSEVDPLQLIPGYSDLITVLKKGKLEDDAMGAVGKLMTAGRTGIDLILGKETEDPWRTVEDSAGQIIQIMSGVPLKNIMRDLRAMYNWFIGKPYADRETSRAVLKYQQIDSFNTADNLWGTLNSWLGEAGYDTSNTGYYKRVYSTMKEGREEEKTDLIDYLLKGKGIKKMDTITSNVQGLIKKDYAGGGIKRNRAEELLRINKPEIKDKDLFETLDEIDYEKETGEDINNYSVYKPIYDAIENRDNDKFIERKKYMIENGYKESDINEKVKSYVKGMYEEGTVNRKDAENMIKKYIPDIKQKDVTEVLDKIDYEKKTGKSVDNYSMYTPVYDAIDKDSEKDLKDAKNYLLKNGYEEKDINSQIKSRITGQYKDGKISKTAAESKLKKFVKSMTKDDIWFTLDRIDYQKAGGKDTSDKYYRFNDAVNANSANDIRAAVNDLLKHGITQKKILDKTSDWKKEYLAADNAGKRKIRDAIQKVYKAAGSTAEEADKKINKWK